jgi:DNA (cytosine-5)-methyltransferase 1
MLKVLDLFSGIGGFSLGLERTGGFETVAFCEIEDYPRRVLAKHWPDVPIYKDVKELTYERLEADGLGGIDIIVGGYPCQPFSHAGKRRGAEDDRHLWPEVHRLVASIRPTWCLFENVAGHISMGLDEVLFDMENKGYACQPLVIPACAADAQHRRDRVWILAYTGCSGVHERRRFRNVKEKGEQPKRMVRDGFSQGSQCERKAMADTGRGRQPGPGPYRDASDPAPSGEGQAIKPFNGSVGRFWCPEPDVGRVANGVPRRVDRLKCLGNAVVPQIPEMIGYAILEAENA